MPTPDHSYQRPHSRLWGGFCMLLGCALFLGTSPVRGQADSPGADNGAALRPGLSLPWRHLDPRLTYGLNPNLAAARIQAGQEEEQVEGDQATLLRITRQSPENHQAQILLAEMELKDGRRDRAAERFLFVALRDGTEQKALSGLAASLLADDSLDPALKLLQEMERRNMLTPPDSGNLAWGLYKQRKFAQALNVLKAEMDRQTASGKEPAPTLMEGLRYNSAVVLLSMGQTDEAMRMLDAMKAGASRSP